MIGGVWRPNKLHFAFLPCLEALGSSFMAICPKTQSQVRLNVRFFSLLKSNNTKGKITFSAASLKGPFKFELEVDPTQTFPGNFIPKLAARSMIRYEIRCGRHIKPKRIDLTKNQIGIWKRTEVHSQDWTKTLKKKKLSNSLSRMNSLPSIFLILKYFVIEGVGCCQHIQHFL